MFNIDSDSEFRSGFRKETGKLNTELQKVADNNYYQSGYYQPQRNFVGDTWGEQDQHTYTVNGGMDDFIHSGVDANKVKSPPSSARHISRREYKSDVHPQRDGTVFDLTSNSSRPRVSAKDLRSMLKDAL